MESAAVATKVNKEINVNGIDILALPMITNDADAKTVREYLKALLRELMKSGESFSGKRPFGNSGWEYDLYQPLVKSGVIPGKLDENGYVEECDNRVADALILGAIESL